MEERENGIYFFKNLEYQLYTDFDKEHIDDHLEDLIISYTCENLKNKIVRHGEFVYNGKNDNELFELQDAVNLEGENVGGLYINQEVTKADCFEAIKEIEEFGLPFDEINGEMVKNVLKSNYYVEMNK